LLRKKIQLETNQDDMLYTFKHRWNMNRAFL
jgi:hypothetical protein